MTRSCGAQDQVQKLLSHKVLGCREPIYSLLFWGCFKNELFLTPETTEKLLYDFLFVEKKVLY